MRVLLVNDHAPGPGSGTEVHVARVASALREAGDEVAVFAGEVVHRGPAKVRDVWDPVARRKLATVARRFQPDVVHHHNVVRELSVSVLGIPRSVAQVLTVHDYRMLRANEGPAGSSTLGPMLWAKSVKGKLDRAIVRRRVDVVIAVSSGLAEGLREAGLPRVTTVENFADPEPCWTAPTGDELLCAGRLSNEKGLDVLIEAFAAVIRGGTAARLRVVGTGPAEATLRALAARLAPGRVVFEGLVSESRVRELMRAARAVCVPSNVNEGAGLVAIEALLVGRPVIATDWPSFRDLLCHDDGDAGLIVPPGDHDRLAGAIRDVLTDDALATRLGRRAYAVAALRLTPDRAVADLHAVYNEALRVHR